MVRGSGEGDGGGTSTWENKNYINQFQQHLNPRQKVSHTNEGSDENCSYVLCNRILSIRVLLVSLAFL